MKESANDPDLTHKRLVQLDAEHRALDEKITALEAQVSPQAENALEIQNPAGIQNSGEIQDSGAMLEIRRLKKQKLVLKDQITQLKAYLTPDIIA